MLFCKDILLDPMLWPAIIFAAVQSVVNKEDNGFADFSLQQVSQGRCL